MQGNSKISSTERYKPVTSDKETVSVGLNNLNYASSNLQRDNQVIQNQISTAVDQATRQIPSALLNIFQTRENAIQENFVFSKTIADNEMQARINNIDTDDSIPANQKAAEKKRLAIEWRNQGNLMIDNLEKNNNFILKKSNLAVGELKNTNQKFFNDLEYKIAYQAQKDNLNELEQNVTATVNGVTKALTVEEVNQNRNFLYNAIVNNPIIANDKKVKLIETLLDKSDLTHVNIRKEEITGLNNKGLDSSIKALNQVQEEIKLLKGKGKNGMPNYVPNLLNRAQKIIEFENLERKIRGDIKKGTSDSAVSIDNISYVETTNQAIEKAKNNPLYKAAQEENDIQSQEQILGKNIKLINLRDNILTNADFVSQKESLNDPKQIREVQKLNGWSNASELTSNQQKVFISSFAQIGRENIQGKNLTPTEKMNIFIGENELLLGNEEAVLKNTKLLFKDGFDALVVEANIKGYDIATELNTLASEKYSANSGGKLTITKNEKQEAGAREDYYKTKRGMSLRLTDPALAEKEAQGFYQISARTGKSIDNLVETMSGSNIYLVDQSSKQNIIFDGNKYPLEDIKYGIKQVKMNPAKFFDLKGLELTEGEKFDMRGNEVVSLDGENLYIRLPANLGKGLIGTMKISDLPPKPISNINIDLFDTKASYRTQEEIDLYNTTTLKNKMIERQEKERIKQIRQTETNKIKDRLQNPNESISKLKQKFDQKRNAPTQRLEVPASIDKLLSSKISKNPTSLNKSSLLDR